jgi:hypothetical protein
MLPLYIIIERELFFPVWIEKKMMKREKNQKEIQELIAAVGSQTSLPQDRVMFALELALEQAVCEFFNVRECQVDVEGKIVIPFFQNLPVIETDKTDKTGPNNVYGVLMNPELNVGNLHKNIMKRCRKLFVRNLGHVEMAYLHEKWKPNVHQAVEGIIRNVSANRAVVHLGDNVQGIMLKPEWVPKEVPFYKEGAVFWFYISRIVENKSAITVYLSRGSKNLPAAFLKEKMPWAKIKIIKRIRGKKTWLKSSALIHPEMIKALQRELKGEVIEIVK